MELKIGNTPMIKIKYKYKGEENYIYTKLEFYNITGSIKDRVAYYIIKKAYENGDLQKGQIIVEATSGNTGISLSAMGAYFGNPVHIFMPDWVSKERVDLMKMYNADVTLISKEKGGFKKAVEKAKGYAEEKGGFLANQFANENNILAHYETTAEEITRKLGLKIGGFVSGIGTGGTLMGVGKCLKESNPNIKVIALEPKEAPLLTKGYSGNHLLEGIGDDFIPEIIDRKLIDQTILIDSKDALAMAKKLSHIGLGVGITTGANVLASILTNGKKKNVTVCPDDSKKYLSTQLVTPIKSQLVDEIELLKSEIMEA